MRSRKARENDTGRGEEHSTLPYLYFRGYPCEAQSSGNPTLAASHQQEEFLKALHKSLQRKACSCILPFGVKKTADKEDDTYLARKEGYKRASRVARGIMP